MPPFRPLLCRSYANGDIRVAVVGLNGRGRNHCGAFRSQRPRRRPCDIDTTCWRRQESLPEGTEVKRTSISASWWRPATSMPSRSPRRISALAQAFGRATARIFCRNRFRTMSGKAANSLPPRAAQPRRPGRHADPLGAGLQEAVAWVRAGNLKNTAARGFCYKRRDSIGVADGPLQIATINFDSAGRRRWSCPANACTTTGTGSTSPATAMSATRVSTKWMSRAGSVSAACRAHTRGRPFTRRRWRHT